MMDRFPIAFHRRMLCEYFFPALVFWAWDPAWAEIQHSLGEPLELRYPFRISANNALCVSILSTCLDVLPSINLRL